MAEQYQSSDPQSGATTGPRYAPPQQPGPARKKSRVGFWIMTSLAALFFISTVVLFLLLIVVATFKAGLPDMDGMGEDGGKKFIERTILGSGDNKILMLPVSGLIVDAPRGGLFRGPGMVASIRQQLKAARKDGAVKAILVNIDSPGGGITTSDVVHRMILDFKEATGRKVVALLGDVAASGGYYVASSADHIVAHPTTITGSIGVIMPLFGMEDLLTKVGLEPRPIKSAEKKDIAASYRALTEEERRLLQGIVDELYERFVRVVSAGFERRGHAISLEKLREELADGSIFTGEQAQANHLVDEIGYLDDAAAAARTLAGIQDARLILYRHKLSLTDLLLARSSVPRSVRIELGPWLPGLQAAPRFMYLWTAGQPVLASSARGNDR